MLFSELSRQVNVRPKEQPSDKLLYVHQVLARLESEFPDIWYGDCARVAAVTGSQNDVRVQTTDDDRRGLAIVCSGAFEETTRYFQELSLDENKMLLPQEQYKMLIAAHVSFGVQVASWLRDQRSHDERAKCKENAETPCTSTNSAAGPHPRI